MGIVETLIVLFAIAIVRGVPMWLLVLTMGSIALMGVTVFKLCLFFDKKKG